MRKYSSFAFFFAALLFGEQAFSSEEYPTVLNDQLEMTCLPTCLVCHTTLPGEEGSATKPFATGLRSFGLVASDEDSLKDALKQMIATGADSDEDGFTDQAELTAELPSDPNDVVVTPIAPGEGMCAGEVKYGCGAQIAHRSLPGRSGWVTLSLLFLMVSATRLVRRRGQV